MMDRFGRSVPRVADPKEIRRHLEIGALATAVLNNPPDPFEKRDSVWEAQVHGLLQRTRGADAMAVMNYIEASNSELTGLDDFSAQHILDQLNLGLSELTAEQLMTTNVKFAESVDGSEPAASWTQIDEGDIETVSSSAYNPDADRYLLILIVESVKTLEALAKTTAPLSGSFTGGLASRVAGMFRRPPQM